MDREKVIKGFECCHVMVHDLGPDKTSCGICPYKDVQTEEQIDLGGIECIAVLHDDALALLKEQEEQKRRWLQSIADNQLANSPTYGKDDNVAYWHKRGIWDGLQIAWEILTEEK